MKHSTPSSVLPPAEQEQVPELRVYKASAGSGKTFTLAVEYITRLVRHPRAYRNILAVTFTNKATAEMKGRILSQLHGIRIGDEGAEAYLRRVQEETGLTEAQVREAAGRALDCLLHDYSRFRVETIDSFFQSVVRNLARELDLGANLEIELDNDRVLNDAVDALIEHLDRQSPVLGWLLEYIGERIKEDKRWDVSSEIKRFGKHLFDEEYLERGNGLREKLRDPDCIRNYRRLLQATEAEALDRMKGFATHFDEVLERHGLTPDDIYQGKRGVVNYFAKLMDGKLSDENRNSYVKACLDSSDGWVKKASPRREQVRALAETELVPLLQEAEEHRARNNCLVTSCRLSLQHLNNVRLLASIDEEVQAENRARNRFLLSDTNALLHGVVGEGDSSFVFEKIGAHIRHVMIDEFQDTSRMQWANFRLLLLEGLSQGADSLVVGDVKQSIYRWRNGDWNILNGLTERIGAFPVRVKALRTNRRSAANIVRFNNGVFTAARQILNEVYQNEQGEPCEALQEAYGDVCQQIKENPSEGGVKVTFLDGKDNEMYVENTLRGLAKEVNTLIRNGIHPEDIAILVRKNRDIGRVAAYFDQHSSYRIVSDEAFRLDASPAVCLLADGLRALADPTNRLARTQAAVAYRREVLREEIDWNALLRDGADAWLPKAFTGAAESLRRMPLYELAEKLSAVFELASIPRQEGYLCTFFDTLRTYLQTGSPDLSAFLAEWNETLCSTVLPAGTVEGIRILSIHKAKGLEFSTVLLPFCDWSLETEKSGHTVWCAPTESPFDGLDLVPVTYCTGMLQSVYRNDYLHERLQLWIDNLNLLYVAFTRAKEHLVVWGKTGRRGTVSALLADALNQLETHSAGTEDYSSVALEKSEDEESGTIEYVCGTLRAVDSPKKETVSANPLCIDPVSIPVRWETSDSRMAFLQSNRSAAFVQGESEAADSYLQQGQLMHFLFAGIRIRSDLSSVLVRMRGEGLFASVEQEARVRKLAERALDQPQAKAWFDGSWEVYNECTVLSPRNGACEVRRPDRVMVRGEEVVVVDFKFGKKRPEYVAQVREYTDLLRRMGYCRVRGYLWYVYDNETEEVDCG